MTLHRFAIEDLPAAPWKNGGGMTREIVCQPPGASVNHFDWRVSIALIASDGPFSSFVGVDRIITLLSGPGVHLQSSQGPIDHRLSEPLVPFEFAGETPIDARLLGGQSHDLNVMTRRSACRASLQVVRNAHPDWACRAGMLLAVRGCWQLQGTNPQTLEPEQGLWWSGASMAWQLQPQNTEAAMLALKIHFH